MGIKRGNSKDPFEEQEAYDAVSYEQQLRTLQGTIDMLEGELEGMRQQQGAVYVKDLETRLYEMQRELMTAHRRNKKLTSTLQEAKEKLEILKEKVDQPQCTANNYGVFLASNEDGTVDIDVSGRKWRVNLDPALKEKNIEVGQEVIVNSGMTSLILKHLSGMETLSKSKNALPMNLLL